MTGLKIGVAKVDYTPQTGLPLMGNFRDDYAARGTHDSLYSRAIVFADSRGKKVAILSLDIAMLDRDNVSLMRKLISSKTDIAPENIFIAATHTHSGPAATGLGLLPKCDNAQIIKFLSKASIAAVEANKNLREKKLFVGYGTESRLSFNTFSSFSLMTGWIFNASVKQSIAKPRVTFV